MGPLQRAGDHPARPVDPTARPGRVPLRAQGLSGMGGPTRRAVTAGLAVLGGAVLLPRPARADLAALEAAARREGAITWYIAQIDAQTAEAMGRAFTARYPRHRGRGDPHHRPGRLSAPDARAQE
ncbi:MAG: hypothetical protein WDO24_04575 [Pseudomonadota bacterium]